VVRAAYVGLLRGVGLRTDGAAGVGFERARRSFGGDVEARLAMGALFRRRLFDRFHESVVQTTAMNLFSGDTHALNPKILERRRIGRDRLEEVIQAQVLNVTLGGRYDVPPTSHRYGALKILKQAVRRLSQSALERRLRATNTALSLLLDGKYVAGPHCFAEWDADVQRFLIVDFLMLGRRLSVRHARSISTPERLIVGALESMRPLFESMGPSGRIHL